jgi:outer membrane protein OmpA-like peptidoglycan-associated protein
MRKRQNENETWVSLSDIMTGLMVIFLFIAISYIVEVKKQQKERDQLFKDFKQTKTQLYNELEKEFRSDFSKWEVTLDRDLSIKFSNAKVLFKSGESILPESFKTILDQFLPRYFAILLNSKYTNQISEIRIEGHTDTVPSPSRDSDPYIANMLLSQARSAEVLKYFLKSAYFKSLPADDRSRLQYWLTANGLSYGHALDSDKKLARNSGKPINPDLSRRVEFRIITASETLVDEVIQEIEGKK